MLDINAFQSSLKAGLARNNLFRVQLPTFTDLPDITSSQLNFMCRNINLPGR